MHLGGVGPSDTGPESSQPLCKLSFPVLTILNAAQSPTSESFHQLTSFSIFCQREQSPGPGGNRDGWGF